ncbi:PorT family protein [Hymenobacter lucidus]|uniref:PorT family protein n=1 Tax=Hymenobacter lucidus TaxID=2880930 RepID=A0ABS8AWD7_9BACT|nr:PorT family protein [Hymenobacter lucidus]MCB2410114.1 PorT family protein [Hymenobacter lucidus]
MKNGRFLLVALLLLLGTRQAAAQRILLQENLAQDTAQSHFGPNRAYYNHFYVGYGLVAGTSAGPGAELRYGSSGEIVVGLRNKLRVSQTLSFGLDLRYARVAYYLAQEPGKVVPDATLHSREYLAVPQAQAELFGQLNFGRRGNVIGRYLDLGGWGGWVLSTAHHYEDEQYPNAKRLSVTEHGLDYMRRWSYGVGARVGSSRYAVTGRYRFSDVFTGPYAARYPELPRWLIGVELGWL